MYNNLQAEILTSNYFDQYNELYFRTKFITRSRHGQGETARGQIQEHGAFHVEHQRNKYSHFQN